jgi:protease-4
MKKLLVIFVVLVVLGLFAALAGILLSSGTRGLAGGDKVLTLTIDRPLLDYLEAPSFSWLRTRSPRSLADIYKALARARSDPSVRGLSLYIRNAPFGFGKAQELHRFMQSLRHAGKSVHCFLETAGEGANGTLAYYLSSACEHIALAPPGELNLVGLYSDSVFLKGTLDKLAIDADFAHVGAYKSASEIFTESEHSPAAEEALASVLDDLYNQIVVAVSESREIAPEEVRALIDRAPLSAQEALDAGLVDALSYPDEFEDHLKGLTESEVQLQPLSEYGSLAGAFRGQRIAVVFAQGTIVRGTNGVDPWSQQRFVGADSMGRILREVAERSDIAGVVLRIDSPGGSAIASDLILREVERVAAHKPVVVSMSDLAASGGYYIAAKAEKIVAEPATITGSIGVVGGKLVTRRFQEELLGITHDNLLRGANADFFSSLDRFSPEQNLRFEELMQGVYDTFVGHVADGRSMTRDEVDAIAGGRIWTGQQALALGLVDELGGIERAIELTLEEAGLEPDATVTLDLYPRPPSWLDFFTGGLDPFVSQNPFGPRRFAPLPLELPPELLPLLLGR